MLYKVLRPFSYAPDCWTLHELAVGDDVKIAAVATAEGLLAEGYIEPYDGPPPSAPAATPAPRRRSARRPASAQ